MNTELVIVTGVLVGEEIFITLVAFASLLIDRKFITGDAPLISIKLSNRPVLWNTQFLKDEISEIN